MKRYIFSLLLGSCFVVWAVLPVRADWEFTKWGMSPEQVVQASNKTGNRDDFFLGCRTFSMKINEVNA
jgi:hypothetical protein